MLERELWKKLPMAQGTIPDLASALGGNSQNGLLAKTGSSSSLSATASQNGSGATSSDGFDAYLAQGNPWRATQGQPAVQSRAVLCCAVLCCAVLCCAVLSWSAMFCAVLCCAVLCCAIICSL